MAVMQTGAAAVARLLHHEGKIDGMVGMGGGGGTSVATAAMRALPVGFPKLMVSTCAAGDTSAFGGDARVASRRRRHRRHLRRRQR